MTKTPKDWKCQECGKRMTLRAAEKASREGCPKCGGVDVDLDEKVARAVIAAVSNPEHRAVIVRPDLAVKVGK